MNAEPLADTYEKLKELRRQGGVIADIDGQARALLDELYRGAEISERLQAHLTDLTSLVRALEIKTLADRVFDDKGKADAWLERPNVALSGQKPADLLADELGTAVVREMLERIDHGIFA